MSWDAVGRNHPFQIWWLFRQWLLIRCIFSIFSVIFAAGWERKNRNIFLFIELTWADRRNQIIIFYVPNTLCKNINNSNDTQRCLCISISIFAECFFFLFHLSTLCNCCQFNTVNWYNFFLPTPFGFHSIYTCAFECTVQCEIIVLNNDWCVSNRKIIQFTVGSVFSPNHSFCIFYNKYLCALIDAVFLFEWFFFLSGSFVSFYCIVKSSFIFLS